MIVDVLSSDGNGRYLRRYESQGGFRSLAEDNCRAGDLICGAGTMALVCLGRLFQPLICCRVTNDSQMRPLLGGTEKIACQRAVSELPTMRQGRKRHWVQGELLRAHGGEIGWAAGSESGQGGFKNLQNRSRRRQQSAYFSSIIGVLAPTAVGGYDFLKPP